MRKALFSPSAILLLIASGVALFALSVLLHAYDTEPLSTGRKSTPGSYSVSAIGHAGFYDVLKRMKRPVSRSVGNTRSMVGANGTLIVAEPELHRVDSEDGLTLMGVPRLLLVLPKRTGVEDAGNPDWISKADFVSVGTALQTLRLVDGGGEVIRTDWPSEWRVNGIGVTPTGPDGTLQLVRSTSMRTIVGGPGGILLGEIIDGNRRIWVLADPDVMANHGLGKGDNAAFMVALVDNLHGLGNNDPGALIVFDETLHGFQESEGTPVKLLFRFPFVIITVLVCCGAVLLALAGSSRFGPPLRSESMRDYGKAQLIDNGARLLDYAGHHAIMLKRYVRMSVRAVAQALHAPPGLDERALAAWLDRIGKARGVKGSCTEILHKIAGAAPDDASDANLARLFECAREVHRWKGEILDGSTANRRHS